MGTFDNLFAYSLAGGTFATVPEEGGGGFSDPTSITGCQLWLDASNSSNFQLTGSDVDQWNDLSGNGNHAIAASLGKPEFNSDRVVFNGSNGFDLASVLFSGAASRTIILAINPTDKTSDSYVFRFGTNAGDQMFTLNIRDSTNKFQVSNFTVDVENGLALADYTQFFIIHLEYDGTNLSSYVNNVLDISSSISLNTDGAVATALGYLPHSTSLSYVGGISEVVVYDSVLSQSDRDTVYNYMAAKLPSSVSPSSVHLLASIISSQSLVQLQAYYDGQAGNPAPDTVPQEVTDARNAAAIAGYSVYLGHNVWYYSENQGVWLVFQNDKNSFNQPIKLLYTFK